MSRHTATTPKFNICLGVDRPLSYVFAQVFLNKPIDDTDNAPGFDNIMTNFPTDADGCVEDAVNSVIQYVRANGEPDFDIPASIVSALTNEVQIHRINRFADLSMTKNHGFIR